MTTYDIDAVVFVNTNNNNRLAVVLSKCSGLKGLAKIVSYRKSGNVAIGSRINSFNNEVCFSLRIQILYKLQERLYVIINYALSLTYFG